jgi:hypothetical protein
MNQPYQINKTLQQKAILCANNSLSNSYKSSINFIQSNVAPISEVARQVVPAVIQTLFFERFKSITITTAKQYLRGESYESIIVCA